MTTNPDATDLSGLVAVVTGAAAGLGRAEAIGLARAGATVVVNDIAAALDASDVIDEITAAGSKTVAVAGDISLRNTADELVETADGLGVLSLLVNNAGITRDRMLFNLTDEDWDTVMAVHLRGHVLLTHNAATYWRSKAKEAGAGRPATSGSAGSVYGRLINTSSEAGLAGPVGQANYGAAKAGIAAFTNIVALELGRYGVTVNAVAPVALTRMTEGLGMVDNPEERELIAPHWIAPIVTWLASPESKGVTGRVFDVSGRAIAIAEGWHRGPSAPPEEDPAKLGPVVAELLAKARKNAGMDGEAGSWPQPKE